MKKQMLIFALLISGFMVQPAYGLAEVKHALGLDKKSTRSTGPKLDKVKFWHEVIKALKKSGYKEDSPEVKHAETYLHRAETRKKHGGSRFYAESFGKNKSKKEVTKKEEKVSKKDKKGHKTKTSKKTTKKS